MAEKSRLLALLVLLALATLMTPGAAAEQIESTPPLVQLQQWHGTAKGFTPAVYGFCVDPLACNGVNDGSGCRAAEFQGVNPAISLDPLLGLVVIDPDGCFLPITDGTGGIPTLAPMHYVTAEAR